MNVLLAFSLTLNKSQWDWEIGRVHFRRTREPQASSQIGVEVYVQPSAPSPTYRADTAKLKIHLESTQAFVSIPIAL